MFWDIYKQFRYFFKPTEFREEKFLFDVAFGFIPRFFNPEDPDDKIIYDEESEVPEILFCQEGKLGVGYSTYSRGLLNK